MQLEKFSSNREDEVLRLDEELSRVRDLYKNYLKFVRGFELCAMEVNRFLNVNGVYVQVLQDTESGNVANIMRNAECKDQNIEVNILKKCPESDSCKILLTKRDILEKIRRKIFERKRQKMGQVDVGKKNKVWRPWLGSKSSKR
ncbi:unnamed protein product [Hermetia illucens]|uniref:Uncharacterized protein n=1 Tax=Hermetia illucens TaxID=343691 RepID=A0A7R8UZG6_HERIL|nr:uncharacterized protein LOC119657795 [Hermetia illucens]CAD7090000.1 unnamed protein product [Hermetia illucens]